MRRWLIALFAVHFLLGVIGFALPAPRADTPVVAEVLPPAQAASAVSQKGLADPAHALGDELPDLPDTLQRQATLALDHVLTPLPARLRHREWPAPAPDAPFRPPRAG